MVDICAFGLARRKQLTELAEYGCMVVGDTSVIYFVVGKPVTIGGMRFIYGLLDADLGIMEEAEPEVFEALKTRDFKLHESGAGGSWYVPMRQTIPGTKEQVIAKLKREHQMSSSN